jgi:hypothetical protein
MGEPLTVGCVVEIVEPIPHRPKLRPGLRGKIVVPPSDLAWAMASVELERPVAGQALWLLHQKYLRRVHPPRPKRVRRSIWDSP